MQETVSGGLVQFATLRVPHETFSPAQAKNWFSTVVAGVEGSLLC
jgi:hypothetical protein